MTDQEFTEFVDDKIDEYQAILLRKQAEYATEDRLHNFRVAAAFQQCTAERALFGFLAKHLVSLSDMCKSGRRYADDIWD
ncbi:MAG: hypothetical protein LBK41_03110 [Clostridiales bacterium]|nr:hypothetical protein [Clostridiales bacterium]